MARRGRTRTVRISSDGSSAVFVDPIVIEKLPDARAIDIPIVELVRRKTTLERMIAELRTKTQYRDLDVVSLYRIASEMIKRRTFNMKRRINTGKLKPNFKLK